MDTDRDGIVAVDEAVKAFFEDETVVEDDLGLDPEETALLAELESEVACGEPDGDEAEGAKKASDDEDADDEAKEASDAAAVFAMTGDPMGLADGPSLEDDALLAGSSAARSPRKARRRRGRGRRS